MPNLHAVNRRIVALLRQAESEKQRRNQSEHMSDFGFTPEDICEGSSTVQSQQPEHNSAPLSNEVQIKTEIDVVGSSDGTALPATSPRKRNLKLILGPTTCGKACRSVQRLPYVRGVPAVAHTRQGPLPKESTLSEEMKHQLVRHDSLKPQQREKGISAELEARMKATRQAFLARARHYMGCLYRKGAQIRPGQFIGNGTEDADLYLDCCGLVRRCVLDLKEQFGFELGPWNQGYLFDTLPMKVSAQDILPGDLIFTQGRYRDNKKKRPPHDIVHVEIFIGGKTGLMAHFHI
jgi:hypothetical protein